MEIYQVTADYKISDNGQKHTDDIYSAVSCYHYTQGDTELAIFFAWHQIMASLRKNKKIYRHQSNLIKY